ncbi:MAG: Holliday junction branch migration protein RuvA [Flavobacteriales bacterium]|nr:Holliday junction branch migration protein RuvA [Flavobacteriales bacterium]
MFEFIEGEIAELSPTQVVINANGVGYLAHISLNAFEKFNGKSKLRLLTHLVVKEDSHTLFGFYDHAERSLFRHLISVSGIGPATARMVLSALNHKEIIGAILNGNEALLKAIKGIGPKAAQRMILELRDKVGKIDDTNLVKSNSSSGNIYEALEALTALGFARAAAEKVAYKVMSDLGENATTENIIKNCLKLL